MQVEEIKNEGLNREYSITIPANELDERRDAKLKEYAKDIKLPGFRPGKAPINILRQRYGKAVLGEILETAVNDTSEKVLKDKGVQPALQPKIEVKEFDEGKDLVYTMALEILPEFTLGEFKGLNLEKPVATAGDKEVNEALERIAGQRRSSKKVEEDRATKKGDIAVIDFKGRTADDNYEHPGMQASDHYLELGSEHFIPGFEEQLIGRKAGDKTEVKVTFPEEYQKDLAGRDAIFDVEIKEIREPAEAQIDNQLARDLGFDDIAALKEAVRGQIQSEYDLFSRMKVKRKLLDMLDEQHQFEVPSGMLDMEYNSIVQQIEQENEKAHGDGEKTELGEEDKQELKDIADRRVRLGLVLAKIGNDNNITVSDQELRSAVIREAQRYPGQEREVFDYFQNNPQALEALRSPLFEEKVVDFIVELSNIEEKEVDPEVLTADDEEEQSGSEAQPAEENAGSSSKSSKENKSSENKKQQEKTASSKSAASSKKSSSTAKKSSGKENDNKASEKN
jgi:trigger factor